MKRLIIFLFVFCLFSCTDEMIEPSTNTASKVIVGSGFSNIINVQDYSSSSTDNTQQIRDAAAAMTDNSVLYFPSGEYNVETEGTLVTISGLNNIGVVFEPGAVLIMDNLKLEGGKNVGSGHAFYFKGPSNGLYIDGLNIKWTRPDERSFGDGLRIDGPFSSLGPDNTRTISNITIKNCSFENTPQTGMILMGCSDIQIEGIKLKGTLADGIHINASRRFNITNVKGENVGDDNIGLVTYYSTNTTDYSSGKGFGPYTQPTLNTWSNYQGTASNLSSTEGTANGIRIAGANNVVISNITVHNRKSAIEIDAGKAGGTYSWSYLASKNIRVSNIIATNCSSGIHVNSYNVSLDNSADADFYNFDVAFNGINIKNSSVDNFLLENCSGVKISDVESSGKRSRFRGVQNIHISNFNQTNGDFYVYGRNFTVDPDGTSKKNNVQLDEIHIRGGKILIQDIFDLTCSSLSTVNSNSEGIGIVRSNNITIEGMSIQDYSNRGLLIDKGQKIFINGLNLVSKSNVTSSSIEVGGGGSLAISKEVRIQGATFINKNNSGHKVTVQGGSYSPIALSIEMKYKNASATSWSTYTY